jgi:hypothetical protein
MIYTILKIEMKEGGKKVRKNCPGLSFNLCFGAFARPEIYLSNLSLRFCLGWVALTVFFFDEEVTITGYINKLKAEIESMKSKKAKRSVTLETK